MGDRASRAGDWISRKAAGGPTGRRDRAAPLSSCPPTG